MYHAYRLQVIAGRHLLIPHSLSGVMARVLQKGDHSPEQIEGAPGLV